MSYLYLHYSMPSISVSIAYQQFHHQELPISIWMFTSTTLELIYFFSIHVAPLINQSSVLIFTDVVYAYPTPTSRTLCRPRISLYFAAVSTTSRHFSLASSDGLPDITWSAWISTFSEPQLR